MAKEDIANKNMLLKVLSLKKQFPVKGNIFAGKKEFVNAVDDISFKLKENETLGLVGESGSGKTTTGRCILRLIDPTSGDIFFENMSILNLPRSKIRDLRRKMQIVFQDPYGSLTPRMKLSSIVKEPLDVHDIGTASQRLDMAASMIEKVGLKTEHMHRYPHEFSGGQRQRICIARSLILKPKLLVADEPVSALDASVRAQIINLLVKLQQEFSLSYLLIAHDLSVVKYMSDRIAVMYMGKIVEMATRNDLFLNSRHPYTRALLSAIPVPEVKARNQRIILKGDIPSATKLPMGCRFHSRCYQSINECKTVAPKLRNIGHEHFVACHLE